MNNTLKFFKNSFFPVLLIIVFSILAWKNYVPGTWLSGWDTLHPEFNIALYLKRIFFGVWQGHQGLGAVASQSHAAELTRLPIVLILSLIFSPNLVRYLFFFLTLILGSLGVYFLSNYLLSQHATKYTKGASFIASLFYVLNLATLQQYYVPLEMFAVHFASLPWLILTAVRYLREGGKKNLIVFSLITLFSSSMAHTATLFYAYFLALSLFIFTSVIFSFRKSSLKRGVFLLFLTIIINLFWLAPNVYYVLKESSTVSNSKISTIFSDEAFLQSKAFGDYKNLVTLKNFLYNWREYSFSQNTFVDLLDEWNIHFKNPGVIQIGYTFFTLAIFGIPIAIFKKSKYAISLLPVLLISVVFWINENPPFTQIFTYLRENFPLFKEAIRFPFTKFSFLLVLCLSVFLAYFAQFLMSILGKIKLAFIVPIVAGLALFYYMLPAFNGNFISPSMKVNIPNEYFQAFEWFDKNDHNGRVAKFPINTFWGWNYYSWGYQGGGFTWFGMPQPTLDREFDRWGLYNEDFYLQSSLALYGGNQEDFISTLKKYQVKYLLLDESIINAGGDKKSLYIDEIKKMLSASSDIKISENFGFLTIYETNFGSMEQNIGVPKNYSKVDVNLTYSQTDPVYQKFGDYVQDGGATGFPFVNMDNRGEVKISVDSQNLIFENETAKSKIVFPVEGAIKEDLLNNRGFETSYNCDLKKIGSVSKEKLNEGVLYKADNGGVSCDFLDYPDLLYNKAYVLRVAGVNEDGRSLKIYLYNQTSKKMDLEELLPVGKFDEMYFIYPKSVEGAGYSLNFETRSYGKISSANLVSKVEIYEVDYNFLANVYTKNPNPETFKNDLKINNVRKYGTDIYKIDVHLPALATPEALQAGGGGLIQLGQGYDQGWKAFPTTNLQFSILNFQSIINVPIFNSELKHEKVNGWANGWFLEGTRQQALGNSSESSSSAYSLVPSASVFIVFWPQLLEWGGALLGIISFIFIVSSRGKKTHNT